MTKTFATLKLPSGGGGDSHRVPSQNSRTGVRRNSGRRENSTGYLKCMHPLTTVSGPAKCTERVGVNYFWSCVSQWGWCHGAVIDRRCAWSSWASLPCRNTPFALLQYFHRGMQRIDTTECAHPLTHIARPGKPFSLFASQRLMHTKLPTK